MTQILLTYYNNIANPDDSVAKEKLQKLFTNLLPELYTMMINQPSELIN